MEQVGQANRENRMGKVCKRSLTYFNGEKLTQDEIDLIDLDGGHKTSFTSFVLDHDTHPGLPYRKSRMGHTYHTINYEERKMLLNIVRFLTEYGGAVRYVINIGVNTLCLPVVAKLFPNNEFYMYETTKCTHECEHRSDNIPNMHNGGILTDTVARKWAHVSSNITLVSNLTDMDAQKSWYDLLQPSCAMLRFQLPFWTGKGQSYVSYLDGELWFQAWTSRASTETRLVINGSAKLRSYDIHKYENQLSYHNFIVRVWTSYGEAVNAARRCTIQGIDNCADCAFEWAVWKEYHGVKSDRAEARGNQCIISNCCASMADVAHSMHQPLDMSPHGKVPRIPMPKRNAELAKLNEFPWPGTTPQMNCPCRHPSANNWRPLRSHSQSENVHV